MPNIWFTADTHFGHTRIIEYTNRPFANADEMDEAMITNWNAAVKPDDTVYHLGDFCFRGKERAKEILDTLHGNISLILGNHDRKWVGKMEGWADVSQYKEIVINNKKVVLFHYPIESWRSKYHKGIHLHGHCHGNLSNKIKGRLDVGVDCFEFTPVEYEQIREHLKTNV